MLLKANTVYNKDVMEVLKDMPDNSVDMIFGDPDYNVGINYDGAKYTKRWPNYIDWYIKLTKECMRVLKPTGNLIMVNYPKQNSYLRTGYLDNAAYEVFDYVWVYNTNVGMSPRKFTTAHRSILHAVKSKDNYWDNNAVGQDYKNPTDKRIIQRMADGHRNARYSWNYFDLVKNVSKDKTFHACQLPRGLVEMFILAGTRAGDLVHVLFGGSGGELLLCKELNRNFISSELHKPYYDLIIERLKTVK
jgi:site-specific DNA-methyltransferase (adenine-specific)